MYKRILCALFCLAPIALWAQEAEPLFSPPSLAEMTAQADLVALTRVADTDYEYTREFPIGGTAFLQVLIPYKVSQPYSDIIDVYEEGLHERECYFKDNTVYEEGRRFLVFLRLNPEVDDQYLGMPQGCALQVLVAADNSYILRYPLSGIAIDDDVSALAQPMSFQDSYAVFDDEDMTVEERNALLDGGYLERTDEGFRYTHGVALTDLRQLMGPENMTTDRTLLKPVQPEPLIIEDD